MAEGVDTAKIANQSAMRRCKLSTYYAISREFFMLSQFSLTMFTPRNTREKLRQSCLSAEDALAAIKEILFIAD